MKQLNTRRAEMLRTEKIAVLNEGGTVEELNNIFKGDYMAGSNIYYYIVDKELNKWQACRKLPDGYTANPISWFYEADEVKPTFDELKAMSLEDRKEALKKMGYVDGAEYKSPVNGRDESFIIDTKRSEFGRSATTTIAINGGLKGDWLMWDGKWAEIISMPDEAPKPEYVKVVKCESSLFWYSKKVGEVFKVNGIWGKLDYEVYFNGCKGTECVKISDCIPCDANGNPIGENPEAEIIGWELMIDVPEVELKAGDKAFEIYKTVVTFPNRSSIFKSVIRQIGIPIYKRTTTDILNAVKQGTMSVEDAVKELEQK